MGDHGFLSRRAIARAERKLAPVLEPGERILEFEIFPLPGSPIFPGPAQRVDALLSDRAVYLMDTVQSVRIPIAEISEVIVEGPRVGIRLVTDQLVVLGAPAGRPRAFVSMLQSKVPSASD